MRREELFFDTSAWIALAVKSDQYHDRAAAYYRELPSSVKKWTSQHVIAETYTWLRYKTGYPMAAKFLAQIRKAEENQSLFILYETDNLFIKTEQILHDFPDQRLSYVDACSMAMMKEKQIWNVFTFDHHISLLGFRLVPT